MSVPDELCVSAWVCACMRVVFEGVERVFSFESTSPRRLPEAAAVLPSRQSVSFPHKLCCSHSCLRHLLFRDKGWQTCRLISFTFCWRGPSSVQTLLCVFCFELGVTGDKKERNKNTRREEGSCYIVSSWINGRKNGTINPPFSLCAVHYRIWWRQSAM